MSKKSKLIRNIFVSVAVITSFTTAVRADDEVAKQLHVRVFDNGECTFFKTSETTVGQLLEENGIVLEENDNIDKDLSEFVENEMRINIERAKVVKITIDKKTYKSFKTGCETIGELMSEMGKEDGTEYILATPKFSSSMKIEDEIEFEISSVKTEEISTNEEIPFETVKKEDNGIKKGTEKVKTKGENGVKTITVKNVYVGGELKETTVVSEEITKEAVDEVILIGTYIEPEKPAEPQPQTIKTADGTFNVKKEMTMRATGYCAYAPGCGLYTATGAVAKKGVVAVDKSVIPLGTKLYIDGYGVAIAADTGGAIKGDRIDLCFDNYNQAVQFGRKNMKVYIIG